jgi:hypothetical protein
MLAREWAPMRVDPWAAMVLVMTSTVATAIGCSGTGAAPLGGPYGGSEVAPSPGPENLSMSDSGTSSITGDAGAAEVGAPDDDAGNSPTWTSIFKSYLNNANLSPCRNCHNEMNSAANSYAWLNTQGYIDGTSSPLVNPAQSCLTWYGGDMPPGGSPNNPAAVADMNAWAAAGALDN